MAPHQDRFLTRLIVAAAIVACILCTSVVSGAKCNRKSSGESRAFTTNDPGTTQRTEIFKTTQPSAGSSGDDISSERSINNLPTPGSAGGSAGGVTFGDITSAAGQCVVGNPTEYITTHDVNWVYDNRIASGVPAFKNYIFDQVVANNGSLNYCVRWDSTNKLSKEMASKFEPMLNRQFKAWNEWLIGYDCWPFKSFDVKIVGWAVRDASLLDWSDDSLGTIYDGVFDASGSPQCPDDCYKTSEPSTQLGHHRLQGNSFRHVVVANLGAGWRCRW